MVLFRWRWMRFLTVSYFRSSSLETNVIFDSTMLFHVDYNITISSDVHYNITIHDMAIFDNNVNLEFLQILF